MHPKTAARRAALHVLVALENPEINLPQALAAHVAPVPDSTRAFARELSSGTVRHRALLDWTLAPLLKKSLARLDAPVRAALRLGCYERTMLRTPPPVAGNEYSQLMKHEKLSSAAAMITAIVRRLPDEPRDAPSVRDNPAQHLATRYSHPLWLAQRWLQRFGFEVTSQLMESNNQVAPLSLRVNTLCATRDEVLQGLNERGIKARAGYLSPESILVEDGGDPVRWQEWGAGKIIAQDEGAQLIAPLTQAQPGQTLIDACAAPGGKTTHLAQLIEGRGRVIAYDFAGRLKLVRENAARLGMACIETHEGGFQELAASLPLADVLLLDAPCTGTGTLRRRPDAKWRRTPEQLQELVQLQKELLNVARAAVKPGGVLVYSTCSLENEENHQQVERFLADNSGWALEATVQTLPHRDGCDGAFGVRLRLAG